MEDVHILAMLRKMALDPDVSLEEFKLTMDKLREIHK